ncbi:hypothetical protein GCM10023238_12850 [Streptomyces heliomycini]
MNTFIGHGVDHAVDDKEQKPAEKAQMTSTEFYGKGAEQLGSAYSAYVNGSKGGAEVANKEKWASDIESAYYGVGSHENEHRGRTPYEIESVKKTIKSVHKSRQKLFDGMYLSMHNGAARF